MKTEKSETLKIKLKGEDVESFKSAINKVVSENKKVGFDRSGFTEKEKEVIKNLNDKLK